MANDILHVRTDAELESMIQAEVEVTGWTKSQVVRYALRRAFHAGMTPREAGAREGFVEALAIFKEGVGEAMSGLFQSVITRLR